MVSSDYSILHYFDSKTPNYTDFSKSWGLICNFRVPVSVPLANAKYLLTASPRPRLRSNFEFKMLDEILPIAACILTILSIPNRGVSPSRGSCTRPSGRLPFPRLEYPEKRGPRSAASRPPTPGELDEPDEPGPVAIKIAPVLRAPKSPFADYSGFPPGKRPLLLNGQFAGSAPLTNFGR